jgi:hypothetical protein
LRCPNWDLDHRWPRTTASSCCAQGDDPIIIPGQFRTTQNRPYYPPVVASAVKMLLHLACYSSQVDETNKFGVHSTWYTVICNAYYINACALGLTDYLAFQVEPLNINGAFRLSSYVLDHARCYFER